MFAFGVSIAAAAGLYTWWRRKRQATAISWLREVRALATRPPSYRRPGPDDAWLVELTRFFALDQHELEQLGFRVLGDLIVERPGVADPWVLRGLIDAAGTTCACMRVGTRARVGFVLQLESFGADRHVLTARGIGRNPLAMPAWLRVQVVDPLAGLDQLWARHRMALRGGPGERDLQRIATLDELAAALTAGQARYAAWRTEQDPEQLLEEDLRGLLGADYQRHRGAWSRRLTALPTARRVVR